ncbi:MAG: ABC transporter substrate-binding protein, partial [Mesorhizobium sp.]
YAAVEIAKAATALAEPSGKLLADALAAHDFSTAIGPIRFDGKGDLTENLYRVFRFNGANFVPAEAK